MHLTHRSQIRKSRNPRIRFLVLCLSVMWADYENKILARFAHQAKHNDVYQKWIAAIGVEPNHVKTISQIPFLPIQFFQTEVIKTGTWQTSHIFKSSGTQSKHRSHHHIQDVNRYLANTRRIFEQTYAPLNDMVVMALLPGYAPDSSLVAMTKHFIETSDDSLSGFYHDKDGYSDLIKNLQQARIEAKPTLLIGVTFSLLAFAIQHKIEFPDLIVMETGGMKGRGEELTRDQVHAKISKAFGVKQVHSEYGMTELQSQAYSKSNGIFQMNQQMFILPGDVYDPLGSGEYGQTCRLRIIDLANEDSCAFINTGDLGKVYSDGTFEVLGRMDHAEVRGCNLLFS